ncbi:MAG: YdeI/OmpD-associated family protein [Actinobacteria bacterium]|nr:YdeI/OmpD-associated family protein [Actinomycetota bacterium]
MRKAILAEAGKGAGDTLTVVVRNDDAPRDVVVPDELAKALKGSEVARAYFESLSYTHRREYAGFVAEAKKPETRARRAVRTIETLIERAAEER